MDGLDTQFCASERCAGAVVYAGIAGHSFLGGASKRRRHSYQSPHHYCEHCGGVLAVSLFIVNQTMESLTPDQSAAANRRPARQSDGAGNLSAIIAVDRAFPAAVAELER